MPLEVARDTSTGETYVADMMNHRVQHLDGHGRSAESRAERSELGAESLSWKGQNDVVAKSSFASVGRDVGRV